MNFGQSIKSGFSNYTTFKGRASRSEFWFWTLFTFIPYIGMACLGGIIFSFDLATSSLVFLGLVYLTLAGFSLIFTTIILLPDISVSVRRLHDINRSGWWWLINLTVIGILLLIYWACIAGDKEQNKFGKNPLLEE